MQDWSKTVATALAQAYPEVETAKDCFLFWDGLVIGLYLALTYPKFSQKLLGGILDNKSKIDKIYLSAGLATLVEFMPEPL